MAAAAIRTVTYEDLLAVPPNLVAEILFWQLVTHPRPVTRNIKARSLLGGMLVMPFELGVSGPRGWWVLDKPELHLGPHIAVPDLAAWRHEHMPEIPNTPWIDLVPDWPCEVLSPSTEAYDKGDKREIYAEAGLSYLWHVDRRLRILEAYELSTGRWLLAHTYRGDDMVDAAPFGAVPFRLSLLWATKPEDLRA